MEVSIGDNSSFKAGNYSFSRLKLEFQRLETKCSIG